MPRKWIRQLTAIALTALLLCLTACGTTNEPSSEEREQTNSGIKGARIKEPETETPGKEIPGKSDPEPAGEGQPLTPEGHTALERIQRCMESQPKVSLAAVCLGEPTWHDPASLAEYFKEHFSWLVEAAPFLLEIPEDRILSEGNMLFFVVPRDNSTSLAVNRVSWESSGNGTWDRPESQVEEVLYRSENAQPLLVFVDYDFMDENDERWPDIQISAVAGNGAEVVWYPDCYPESFIINAPFDEDYDPLILDLDNLTANGLDNWEDSYDYGDDDWAAPTELGLADTNWYCGGDWYMNLSGLDDSAPHYAGLVDIYQIPVNGTEYSGVWKMDGKCLYLQLADGVGNVTEGCYPVEISPSGEELSIREDPVSGARPVFFQEDMAAITLTLVYN